jgi:hypothetical protein
MNIGEQKIRRHESSIEVKASPETIWRVFCDVPGWKNRNAGIEQIGPGCSEVGPAVSADFPEVLKSLPTFAAIG